MGERGAAVPRVSDAIEVGPRREAEQRVLRVVEADCHVLTHCSDARLALRGLANLARILGRVVPPHVRKGSVARSLTADDRLPASGHTNVLAPRALSSLLAASRHP